MRNKQLWSWLIVPILAVAVTTPATAQHQPSISSVYTFDEVRVDGVSVLVRGRKGVSMTLNTRELGPIDAYTIWWINFRNPAQCFTPCACDDTDFQNPDVRIGVFWATGRVADRYGQAQFAANIGFDELPGGADQVPFAPDFAHAVGRRSEIHLLVRSHGTANNDPDALEDQLTMFQGLIGEDTHFAIHRNPKCRPASDDN